MEKGTEHGHTLLARPQLVPRYNGAGDRTTKEVATLREASVDYDTRRSNSQRHEGYQAGNLEALITIYTRNEIAEELQKSKTLRQKVPERTTNKFFSAGVLSTVRKTIHYLCE